MRYTEVNREEIADAMFELSFTHGKSTEDIAFDSGIKLRDVILAQSESKLVADETLDVLVNYIWLQNNKTVKHLVHNISFQKSVKVSLDVDLDMNYIYEGSSNKINQKKHQWRIPKKKKGAHFSLGERILEYAFS